MRFAGINLSNILNFKSRNSGSTKLLKLNTPYTLLLWGPAYDSLTHFTSGWLGALSVPKRVANKKLLGEGIKKSEIRAVLNELRSGRALAIFCGHGVSQALLGPPQKDNNDILVGSTHHAAIYERDLFGYGPSAIYAFCCGSGKGLGRSFASSAERTFLGYSEDILITTRNEECSLTWKNIIHSMCAEFVKDGSILQQHRRLLEDLYDRALHYFMDGDGRKNPENVEMIMALLNHKACLCYYRGGARVPDA